MTNSCLLSEAGFRPPLLRCVYIYIYAQLLVTLPANRLMDVPMAQA